MHLDIRTGDLKPNSSCWKVGAERAQQVHSWWILRDPAGLLFCVVPEPAGPLSDSNAQRGTNAAGELR